MKFLQTICNFRLLLSSIALLSLESYGDGNQKYLVLDPITYSQGVNRFHYDGIDGLLMTKLASANKYCVLDREAYRTAVREATLAGKNLELLQAGYSVSGEVVDAKRTANCIRKNGKMINEYVISVSLRVNRLKDQVAYIGETVRIQNYAVSEKDMLIYVVDKIARKILFKEFPLRIVRKNEQELLLNYGKGFVVAGEQYEVGSLEEYEDPDTKQIVPLFQPKGNCRITDVYDRNAKAVLIDGKADKGYTLQQQHDSKATPETTEGGEGKRKPGVYSCVVSNFGFSSDFTAARFVPDDSVIVKIFRGLFGVFGLRNKNRAVAKATADIISDNSRNERIDVRIYHNEWRSIAERAFAAYPNKFEVHTGMHPVLALKEGIQYSINGNVSQLYEKDGECTVKMVLSLVDLQQDNKVVFSKDIIVAVPGDYQGQATFASAVAAAAGQFASQLP